jgi:mannosyltransferase
MSRWKHWIWPAGILLVGAALRLYALDDDPFWLDEAHTANFTTLSLPQLLSWSDPYDLGNPPGYVLLLKVWVQVSRSDVWMRTFSALAGVLTLPVVYLIGLRLFGRRVALVAMAFLALAGYHIRFSQEARTYALVGLVAAGVMLAVAQLITQPDGDHADRIRGARPWVVNDAGLGLRRALTWTDLAWPAYTLLAGGVFLFHVTGAALAIAANITVVIWWFGTRPRPPRFARNWIIANLGVLVIWMAWIPAFLNQAREIVNRYWVPEPTFLSIMEGGADLVWPSFGWDLPWNGQTWRAAVLVGVVLLLIGIGLRRQSRGAKTLIWSFFLTLPVIEVLASVQRPIFLTRTLLWVMIPLALGLSLAATRPQKWWPLTTGVLLAVSLSGAVAYHATYFKTAWDEAAALVASEADADDLVLVQPANTVVAFDHYFERTNVETTVYGFPGRLPDRTASGPDPVESDHAEAVALALDHDEVWLILNRADEGESLEPTLEAVATNAESHRLDDLFVFRFQMP